MGRAARVPAAELIERERQVLQLKRAGLTFDVIAERLGYANRGGAYKAYKRALARTLQQPAAEVRELEQDRLDAIQARVWQILTGSHPLVQSGKVVAADDGRQLQDAGPVIAAANTLIRLAKRRAELLGLDAPAQVEVMGTVNYKISSVDTDQL